VFRPEVDRDKCIGSGNCVFWAPATFELDDDEGLASILDPAGDDIERIRVAVEGCPAKALSLHFDGEGEGGDAGDTSADGTTEGEI
jgi:ferredoxin